MFDSGLVSSVQATLTRLVIIIMCISIGQSQRHGQRAKLMSSSIACPSTSVIIQIQGAFAQRHFQTTSPSNPTYHSNLILPIPVTSSPIFRHISLIYHLPFLLPLHRLAPITNIPIPRQCISRMSIHPCLKRRWRHLTLWRIPRPVRILLILKILL